MEKKHYDTPTLLLAEFSKTDIVRTSSLTDKDVLGGDVYGDEVWN